VFSLAFARGLLERVDHGDDVGVDLIYSAAAVTEGVNGGDASDLILDIATAGSDKP
jgi:hypothetical protein